MSSALENRVLDEIEQATSPLVDFAAALVRVPTVNPPGEHYEDCARLIGGRLLEMGFEVDYVAAEGRPEHTAAHPRINVVGLRRGREARPLVHLNGHFDVVPPGEGWTVDPFAGEVRDGKLYGRGAADMKGGLAAAMFAADALRRAGFRPRGSLEISGTVDEESGGFAGVAHLAHAGRIAASRTDHVIIPEPLDVDRVCVGHRGVHWYRVVLHGRVAHGSMPFLGASAIDAMGDLLHRVRTELEPTLAMRITTMPVVPEAARRATINVNSLIGGQAGESLQTPCVADRCTAIFDRRFLVEESVEASRAEIVRLLEAVVGNERGFRYEIEDLMIVEPVLTPDDAPLIRHLEDAVEAVLGRRPQRVASPGTYDHKHVARIGGVTSCVAYGPGRLEQAHQPDEWCAVDDLVAATKVMALALVRLLGGE